MSDSRKPDDERALVSDEVQEVQEVESAGDAGAEAGATNGQDPAAHGQDSAAHGQDSAAHGQDSEHVSGFVTLLGVPNVGKSTLLNCLLGGKLAIVTPKPQTTRDRILGVITEDRGQIVLLDTPGVHDAGKSDKSLNAYMVGQAYAALEDADVAVLVVDAAAAERGRAADELESEIRARAERLGVPLLVALNKIDLLKQKETLLPLIERWQQAAAVVPICALDGDGVDRLIEEIWPRLAPGPAFFDGEALTDRSLRWLCAETIREQVFLRTRQEIPYSTAVVVERFTERPDREDTVLEAVIYVERESQKGIVVGRGGQMIKRIGSDARRELEPLLGGTVHLRLRVAVESDWSRSARGMRRVGYEP